MQFYEDGNIQRLHGRVGALGYSYHPKVAQEDTLDTLTENDFSD